MSNAAYGIYKTYGYVVGDSGYVCDIHGNKLDFSSNTTSCEETIFHILGA